MNEQLKKYIDEARQHNIPDIEIKANLLKAGWGQSEVDGAFSVPGQEPRLPETYPLAASTNPLLGTQTKIWAAAIIAILILGGSAYFFYARAKNSPERVWTEFGMNTKQHLSGSAQNTVHADQMVAIAAKQSNGDQVNVQLNAGSDTDARDVKNVVSDTKLSLSMTYQGTNIKIDGIEVRQIGNIVYVDISKIPVIGQSAKDYNGWIKLDGSSVGPSASNYFDANQINRILDQNKIISAHTYEAKETLKGQDTYKYKLTINKDALKNVLASMFDQLQSQGSSSATALSATDLQNLKAGLNTIFDHISIDNAEIWLGVSDRTVRKIVISAQYADPAMSASIDGPLTLQYVGEFSGYGQNISVQAPAKSWDIQKDGNSLLNSLSGQGTTPSLTPGQGTNNTNLTK